MEYPDFKPQADKIQEKLLTLKAAEIDARKAREELSYIENPNLRPKAALNNVIKAPSVSTEAYEKNIDDIKKKVLELKDPYDQAIIKAAEWRGNALKILIKQRLDMMTLRMTLIVCMMTWLKKQSKRR